MLTRAWFVLSMLWASVMMWNFWTREHPGLSWFDVGFVLAPLISGLLLRLGYRYVVYGPRRRLPAA